MKKYQLVLEVFNALSEVQGELSYADMGEYLTKHSDLFEQGLRGGDNAACQRANEGKCGVCSGGVFYPCV